MAKKILVIALTILLSALLVSLMGCEDEDEAPNLTSSHDGWKNPQCNVCHGDAHTDGNAPYQCATCHGSNGAPSRPSDHTGTAPCADCHGTPHGEAGFPDPVACEQCHD